MVSEETIESKGCTIVNSFPTYYPPINVKPTTKATSSGIVFLKTTTPHLLGTYSWYKSLTNAPSMKLEDGKASRPGASQPDRRYIYKSPTTSPTIPVLVGLYIDRHIIIL